MKAFYGIVAFLIFIIFAIAQIIVGFKGIDHELGSVWAWIALILGIGLRFTLPLTVGVFFGAKNVLGWHWVIALFFALPGLLLMIPGAIASILSLIKRR